MNDLSDRSTGIAPLWLAIGGLCSLAAAMGMGRFVYTPILPFMIDAGVVTKPGGGYIASANYLGYLIGALGAALPNLPGGRRTWFISALAASAISTAAMGVVDGIWAFALLRLTGGIASAFVLVLASALILERLTLAGAAKFSALHYAGVGTGIAASALLVAGVASLGGGWRSQWLAAGMFALGALLVASVTVPNAPDPAAPDRSKRVGRLNARLLAVSCAYGLFGFGYVITATFISTIVRTTPALQPAESAVWFAVGLAAAPSVVFWFWVARRIGNDRAFALACFVEAVGVALSVVATNVTLVIAAAAMLGGTIMGITAVGFALARDVAPSGDQRRNMAFMTAAFGVGQMIGPTYAAFAFAWFGGFFVSSMTAAGALVAAALLAHFWGRKATRLEPVSARARTGRQE